MKLFSLTLGWIETFVAVISLLPYIIVAKPTPAQLGAAKTAKRQEVYNTVTLVLKRSELAGLSHNELNYIVSLAQYVFIFYFSHFL